MVSEVQVQNIERSNREVCGGKYKITMRMEEGRNTGIECYGRSCTYNCESTAEGICIRVNGDIEREDSDKTI